MTRPIWKGESEGIFPGFIDSFKLLAPILNMSFVVYLDMVDIAGSQGSSGVVFVTFKKITVICQ